MLAADSTRVPSPERPSATSMKNEVCIHVGGRAFHVNVQHLQRYPDSKLGRLVARGEPLSEADLTFDRDPDIFDALLQLYRTDELALPEGVSDQQLQDELAFFGMDDVEMEEELDASAQVQAQVMDLMRSLEQQQHQQHQATLSQASGGAGLAGLRNVSAPAASTLPAPPRGLPMPTMAAAPTGVIVEDATELGAHGMQPMRGNASSPMGGALACLPAPPPADIRLPTEGTSRLAFGYTVSSEELFGSAVALLRAEGPSKSRHINHGLALMSQLLAKDAANPTFLYYMAYGEMRVNRYAEAHGWLDRMEEVSPGNLSAHTLRTLMEDRESYRTFMGALVTGAIVVCGSLAYWWRSSGNTGGSNNTPPL